MRNDLLSVRISKKAVLLAIIMMMVCVTMMYSYTSFITIKNIKIRGTKSLSDTSIYFHESLLILNVSEVEEHLFKKNPHLETISVRKSYPNTLLITVKENRNTAYIKGVDGIFFLGNDGRIISKQKNVYENVSVPEIHYYQTFYLNQIKVGERVENKEIASVLDIIQKMKDISIEVITIDIHDENMIVCTTSEDYSYVFTSENDVGVQVLRLSVIKRKLQIDGDRYKGIDVRYEKPIVTY